MKLTLRSSASCECKTQFYIASFHGLCVLSLSVIVSAITLVTLKKCGCTKFRINRNPTGFVEEVTLIAEANKFQMKRDTNKSITLSTLNNEETFKLPSSKELSYNYGSLKWRQVVAFTSLSYVSHGWEDDDSTENSKAMEKNSNNSLFFFISALRIYYKLHRETVVHRCLRK